MNKKTALPLALVAVLAGGGLLVHRSPAAGAPSAAKSTPQAVTLFTVQQRDVPVTVDATGSVVSLNSVDVRPQVASTIRRVAIREGQYVKAGELLFSFDDRPDRANLEKAQAQLARDRATQADLQRQWQRAQDLRAQNFVAQSAVDTALSQLDAQHAAVRSDEAAVHAAQVSLGYNEIRSPLAGRAGAIGVYPGSLVQPNGNALVTISQIDPVGVSFTVPEAELSALLAREAQGVDVEVRRGDAPTAAPRRGRVSFVDNTVDPSTGTIRVKASVPNADHGLWPGQFVTVRLTVRTLQSASVVPQAALILRENQRSVYVVDGHQTAQLRPVHLLYASGETAVVDGVKPGERVVVEGKQNVKPGGDVVDAGARAASGAAQ
jgi:RND family efflux transporter MFP subunit